MNIYVELCKEKLQHILAGEITFEKHRDYLLDDIQRRIERAGEIVICGLSPMGKRVQEYIGEYSQVPVRVVDIRDKEIGQNKDEMTWDNRYYRVFVICSREESLSYLDLIPRCNSDVITYNEMFLFDERFGMVGSLLHSQEFVVRVMHNVFDHASEYLEMLEGLRDRFSKETLARWLLYRLYGDVDVARGIAGKGKSYFDSDFIYLTDDEIFVDEGGYNGDTLTDFKEVTNNHYRKYFFIEPESKVYELAKKRFANDRRIEFIKKGLAETTTTKYFDTECEDVPEMMQSDNGNVAVKVVGIDDMNIEPTFIKMDIEGAECDALDGARRTIKKYLPKLAICVYHRPNDILDVYHRIVEYGYKNIYLRADKDTLDYDVVLYATP